MAVYLISVRNAEGFYFIIFCSVVYSARFSLHFSYPQRGAVLFQITVSCPTASPEINGTQHFSSSSTSRKSKLDECTHWNTHRVLQCVLRSSTQRSTDYYVVICTSTFALSTTSKNFHYTSFQLLYVGFQPSLTSICLHVATDFFDWIFLDLLNNGAFNQIITS